MADAHTGAIHIATRVEILIFISLFRIFFPYFQNLQRSYLRFYQQLIAASSLLPESTFSSQTISSQELQTLHDYILDFADDFSRSITGLSSEFNPIPVELVLHHLATSDIICCTRDFF